MMEQLKIEKTHPELLFQVKGSLYHLVELLDIFRRDEYDSMADVIEPLLLEPFVKRIDQIFIRLKKDLAKCNPPISTRLIAKGLLADSVFVEAAMTVCAVLKSKPNYYIIQNDFLKKFLKVKLDKLQFSHLPNASGYIKLPFPLIDAEGTEYHHVYFFVGNDTDFVKAKDWRSRSLMSPVGGEKVEDLTLVNGEMRHALGSRLLQIAFLEHPKEDDIDLSSEHAVRSFGFRLPKNEDQLLTSFLSEITDTHTMTLDGLVYEQKKTSYSDYLRVIVNLIMYIHSGEPDIREFRNSLRLPGQRKRKVISSETLSVLNLKLVGFNWKKNIIKKYSLKSWDVDGHFRWQRYGKQWSLVKTDFILIVQTDGFIVNIDKWTDQFLEYDYIGSPWHHSQLQKDMNPEHRVGNGGFSLRSRRLHEFLRDDPNIVQTHPEDVIICQTYRDYLEDKGFTFAPVELSHQFGCENYLWNNAFGQHQYFTLHPAR